jgi:hypothetical protein
LRRRAKKRNVGCSDPTQTAPETARPVELMESDFESVLPVTFHDSLPATTEAPVSDHALGLDSNEPPGSRL